MNNCAKDIFGFYKSRVRLSEGDRANMRNRRQANENRLETGLTRNGKPLPKRYIKQGSYAMHTMVQHPDNDYDIDDGVLFAKEKLVGPQCGEMTSLDARKMVCEALQDAHFTRQPAVKTNCVRVFYNEGYHIDMPVYREVIADDNSVSYELAGSTWRVSDPEAITRWFNDSVIEKSPDTTEGRQLRRTVCLLKAFTRSRSTWNMPSGLILSTLAVERYVAYANRDDEALYEAMRRIWDRLVNNLVVKNPVDTAEEFTRGTDDPKMKEFRDKLTWALEQLSCLTKASCTRLMALKAWKMVFNTDYFDDEIIRLEDDEKKKDEALKGLVSSVGGGPKPWQEH